MRYTDGTKNNDVTAVVRADGLDCPELRGSSAGSDGQCWIAVKSGQAISVFCDVKLAASQYQIDLVIDGVLRNIVVSTVCPKREDRAEIVEFFEGNHKYTRSLFRSPLVTSRLQDQNPPIIYNTSDNTRVGTIEVLVYRYDLGYNHTRAAELPENVVDWEDLEGQPGCAGVEPTHEIVMVLNNGKRLNDTERRTWKNKSEKLPMGRAPWASFKFLYRHETTLRGAALIDRRLNIVPTAVGMSSLRAGLLSFHNDHDTESPVAYTRFNGNPWVVRERNGLREYKQLDINPDKPGPQISKAHSNKRNRGLNKGKKPTNRRSYDEEDDSDSDSPLAIRTPSKRMKFDVNELRAEVGQLQLKRDEARRNLEEQSKTKSLQLNLKQERTLLTAQKQALGREIEYITLEAAKYKKCFMAKSLPSFKNEQERYDDVEEQYNGIEADHAAENSMLIDPALTAPDDEWTSECAVESPGSAGESPEYTVETPTTGTTDDQVLDLLAASRSIADESVSGGSVIETHTDERLDSQEVLSGAADTETPLIKVISTSHSANITMPANTVGEVILGHDAVSDEVEHAMAAVNTLLSAAEIAADIASLHGTKL